MTPVASTAERPSDHQLAHEDGSLPGITRDRHGRVLPTAPWPAHRGALHALLHGRLTNRDDLCRDLGRSPAAWSDHELVLEAYVRWQERGLERLRGVYMAALVDGDRQLAFVVRDQVGCHPVFHAAVDGGRTVLFGTSPRELLRQPGVPPELNRPALADHLCRRWPDREETFFLAIRRLPPGFRLRVSAGAAAAERYWDPVPEDRPVTWITGDAAERFELVFDRAVERCLGHGPSGIFLSGGFDSISIAAMATDRARASGHPAPIALSLEFPHPGCNERPTQQTVAEALGLRQRFLGFHEAVGSEQLLAAAIRLNDELGAPVLNAWFPAYLSLARAGREAGVTTIMTGSGGDEWLGVSPLLSADLIRRGDAAGLVRFMRTWQRSYSPDRLPVLRNALWTYGLRPLGSMLLHRLAPDRWQRSRAGRAMRRDPAYVAPDPALRAEQRRRVPGDMLSPDPPLGFYVQDARSALDHTLVSWELEEQFQMGRMAGVWFQHPYWDADLIDMLYRTPPEQLNAGGRSKGLVRGAMARRFPALGLERRRKVGAATFYRSILAGEGPAVVASGFPVLESLGVVDGPAARAGLAALFDRRRDLYRAWEVANLESWVSQFV